MNRHVILARTALRLGVCNVLRLANYRLGVKFGWNRATRLRAVVSGGDFFNGSRTPVRSIARDASQAWRGEGVLFGWKRLLLNDEPPAWHGTGDTSIASKPWWRIPDFDGEFGDIKTAWELSRMDWLLPMAQRAALGESHELSRINFWLRDWCACNPPYSGPNWKCGQEAAFRVLHLATAALLLGEQTVPTKPLRDLIRAHLERIVPTMDYAKAQDNNHGTSEAAALFVGGSWLHLPGDDRPQQLMEIGRRTLEERVLRLVANDGSFSQYSLTYQRLLLDTLCIAEVWRSRMRLPAFSEPYVARCAAAARWLHAMTDPENGNAPNIGANDGARLVPLTACEHNDFRPTVQLASALFLARRAYEQAGRWDDAAGWLAVDLPDQVLARASSALFDDGGYALLSNDRAKVIVRFPRFRFRPSHADALHVDLWVRGENVLRDGGTYSYAADPDTLTYFAGTASHNTVQFDDRGQMPRISRFLFGDWLETETRSEIESRKGSVSFRAAYRDSHGARHAREVRLGAHALQVTDRISDFLRKAVLRWRLCPGDWRLQDGCACSGSFKLSVRSNRALKRMELTRGWESRFYLKRDAVPVLEVEVDQAANLETELSWS